MRVTKTVKEYITKEVSAKLEKKYAEEAAEAKRQSELMNDIENAALTAASAAYKFVLRKGIQENNASSFLEIENESSENCLTHTYRSSDRLILSDRHMINSVHHWRDRMNEEIRQKVNEIIVTLELGGSREELMQMLEEI